jgi:hypothetical protein
MFKSKLSSVLAATAVAVGVLGSAPLAQAGAVPQKHPDATRLPGKHPDAIKVPGKRPHIIAMLKKQVGVAAPLAQDFAPGPGKSSAA